LPQGKGQGRLAQIAFVRHATQRRRAAAQTPSGPRPDLVQEKTMALVLVDPQSGASSASARVDLDPSLSFEAWRLLGAGLATGYDASCWSLGDWASFGRARYGRFYRDALFATGLDRATLGEYAAVARRFAPSRRRDDLTFRHHAEVWTVADDDVQDAWLAAAAARRWSWKELHRRLRAADGPPRPGDDSVVLAAGHDQTEQWRKAATRSRCALDEWILSALDRAAARAAFGH